MTFKIELIDSPSFAKKSDFCDDEYKSLEAHELSEAIEEVFHSNLPSDFLLLWGNCKLKYDFISFGETLEEWLSFANWLIFKPKNRDHYDPWCSGVELSFDAFLSGDGTVKMTVTDGDIMNDANSPNTINDNILSVLNELSKVFIIAQKGLSNKNMHYPELDIVISKTLTA